MTELLSTSPDTTTNTFSSTINRYLQANRMQIEAAIENGTTYYGDDFEDFSISFEEGFYDSIGGTDIADNPSSWGDWIMAELSSQLPSAVGIPKI